MQRYTVLSMGDPAGQSPEMIIKAARILSGDPALYLIVTGDEGVFRKTASDLSMPLPFTFYTDDRESLKEAEDNSEQLIFYNTSSIDIDEFCYGKVSAETGEASYEALKNAVEIIQNGLGQTLVTMPVSGEALRLAGYKERSVFGLLSLFASSARLSNMLRSGNLNIFGLTHRRSVRSALEEVKRENIISTLVEIDSITSSPYFDSSKPIAVSSLNPMKADGSWTGTEEDEAIIPAVETVRKIGINAIGPLPVEEVFAEGVRGKFSAELVMTASEGFAAAAAASSDKACMITWGLPFMRVAPLIEAGFENAGKGTAETGRLEAAISLANLFRHSSLMA
ncbi:MAG: 4-hydroxythreonine-4-phosphate dehydrogenase PdxA [Spirochaetes bacterium]|uniref:4-hydroxythreonine-4-phosphate dehydrogenase PdxA n=1 Tax=Candidatus Ornithospirochaeta stercoripullorum TaxID=2840899 RepID=A0A9D9H5I0_9SPIO|nr:4-hydroxythreonine-4-phosphate dehydrogenase PdxA [Candidatus Ornithospirochaeta stercoripullorum]